MRQTANWQLANRPLLPPVTLRVLHASAAAATEPPLAFESLRDLGVGGGCIGRGRGWGRVNWGGHGTGENVNKFGKLSSPEDVVIGLSISYLKLTPRS